MREVTAIEPKWLTEAAPTFFKVADANAISKRKRSEKIQPLYNKYEKPNEWRLSRVKRHQRVSQTFGSYDILFLLLYYYFHYYFLVLTIFIFLFLNRLTRK